MAEFTPHWMDNRSDGTGYDIWANVLDGDFPTDIHNEQNSEIPTNFYLTKTTQIRLIQVQQ